MLKIRALSPGRRRWAFAAATMLMAAGCSQSGGNTTLDRGDRIVPDSSGKCTQMIGTQEYKVKCPDQK